MSGNRARVPSSETVAERRERFGRFYREPIEVPVSSELFEQDPEFAALEAEWAAVDRAKAQADRRVEEVHGRNRVLKAEYRQALEQALEAGTAPPPAPVLEQAESMNFWEQDSFWGERRRSIRAAQSARILEIAPEVLRRLAPDLRKARSRVSDAEKALAEAERALRPLERAEQELRSLKRDQPAEIEPVGRDGRVGGVRPGPGMEPVASPQRAAEVVKAFDESRAAEARSRRGRRR